MRGYVYPLGEHTRANGGIPAQTPEDVSDFVGEVSLAGLQSSEGQSAALVDQRARQRAFLKRKSADDKKSEWRVRKKHRKTSYQYLCCMHNQLAQFVPDGLMHFSLDKAGVDRQDPRSWPRLSLGPDQGSEGVCAVGFACHELSVCVDTTWDVSHGVWNDLLNGIRHAGLYGHLLLSLLRLNVPLGPWSEDQRWRECRQALAELLSTERPEHCALYQAFLPQLLSEVPEEQYNAMDDPEQDLWNYLKQENPFVLKGTKVCLGRFMDVIRAMKRELPQWHTRSFVFLHTCLEMNMMSSASFRKVAIGNMQVHKSTNSKKETAEERAVRQACQNQLVLATLWMLDEESEALDRIIVAVGSPWEEWHSAQNSRLRSVGDSPQWTVEELQGNFAKTLCATWAATQNERILSECKFCTPNLSVTKGSGMDPPIQREDEIATKTMMLAAGITFWRLRRSAWLLMGVSSRSALLLSSDPEVVRREIRRFRVEYNSFQKGQSLAGSVAGLEPIARRSQFTHPSVLQIIEMLRMDNWTVTSETRSFLQKAHMRLLGSQVVEDGFNIMKNSKPYQNRRGCIEEIMRSTIEKQPLSKKHRFSEIEPACAGVGRDLRLPLEAFRPRLHDMPKEFLPIMSLSQKSSWPSLRPEDISLPHAETRLFSIADSRNEWDKIRYSWLGNLMSSSHNLVVRYIGGEEPGPWRFPLGCWYGSLVLLMPLIERHSQGTGDSFFEPAPMVEDIADMYDVCWDLSQWQARRRRALMHICALYTRQLTNGSEPASPTWGGGVILLQGVLLGWLPI